MQFIKPFHFSVENLGCAKNQVDAEVMISCLVDAGAVYTEDSSAADLIIVNTCGFIDPAKEQSINHTLSMRELFPDKKIIMSGCLSQRFGKELAGDMTEVDGFFGNGDLSLIVEIADKIMHGEKTVMIPAYQDRFVKRQKNFSMTGSSFIKIGEGCSNNCSYCAIPLIRGGLKSRPAETIIEDIRSRIAAGDKEFCLISQDLGSWGRDFGQTLPDLLKLIVTDIKEDVWFRLLYLHPDHFPYEILELMKQDARILPYFDIPFQHASGKILTLMGRSGNSDKYLQLLARIRKELPDAVFRSTFLVGFPTETQEDFDILLDFQKKAAIDWVGVFPFSLEEGTAAADLVSYKDYQKQEKVRKQRVQQIEENQIPVTQNALSRLIGKELDVLVEEKIVNEDLCLARPYFCAPEVDGLVVVAGTFEPGTKTKVKLTRLNGVDFDGIPC